ncbi:hypothetical protein DENSPDRAFT_841394 [Dentipellis sp. KUC8613]|nr:hypothetical protein DENSPDRAFT_841394 [Dentipellis sp. KUC8613]
MITSLIVVATWTRSKPRERPPLPPRRPSVRGAFYVLCPQTVRNHGTAPPTEMHNPFFRLPDGKKDPRIAGNPSTPRRSKARYVLPRAGAPTERQKEEQFSFRPLIRIAGVRTRGPGARAHPAGVCDAIPIREWAPKTLDGGAHGIASRLASLYAEDSKRRGTGASGTERSSRVRCCWASFVFFFSHCSEAHRSFQDTAIS